ncbi:unnamed protein product [Scytosiphon promiscuus]
MTRMRRGRRQALAVRVALVFALFALSPHYFCAALQHGAAEEFIRHDHQEDESLTAKGIQKREAGGGGGAVVAAAVADGAEEREGIATKRRAVAVRIAQGKSDGEVSEAELIQPIDTPFRQRRGEWERRGISLTAMGEPKSGTTWLARVIVELCLQLCGNPENRWCKMGGLRITDNFPAPRYTFEMLHADTDELFLHFKGKYKHVIPGLGEEGCEGKMRAHVNGFGRPYPCRGSRSLSREGLAACLPDVTPDCASQLQPLDPALRRIAMIFRDARNLIISEHRMRREVYLEDLDELEPYIRGRFKTVVAWIHQRYIWHTTALEEVSHVMFYEDLQTHPRHLVDLAAFLGLDCTPEEAVDVFDRHTYANPPGDYTTYGLSTATLEWMNVTMSKVLPEEMLARYGLTPIISE